MKKSILLSMLATIATIVFYVTEASAQVPHGINYQALLRGPSGEILKNKPITIWFTIHQDSAKGSVAYVETHINTTNEFGLINIQIGKGKPELHKFSDIKWGKSVFLEVEIDDSGLINLGTTQFISVPYALVADTVLHAPVSPGDDWGSQIIISNATLSGNGTSSNPIGIAQQGATSGQTLKWSGSSWLPANDNTGGIGTVRSIQTGIGLIGGPITDSGIVSLDTQYLPKSLPPNGIAGGDLNGTYPNPKVAKIQNYPITDTVPSPGQVLKWNGLTWKPSPDNMGGVGTVTSIETGTGLIGGPINNNGTISIANTGVAAGNYGNSGSYPTFGVNAQGQLISVEVQSLPGSFPPNGQAGGELSGTYPNPSIAKILGKTLSGSPSPMQVLQYNGTNWTPQNLPSGITGSGSTNYLPKFSSPSNLTTSQIYDDGNYVGIGIASPADHLHIRGRLRQDQPYVGYAYTMNITGGSGGLYINHTGPSGYLIDAKNNDQNHSSGLALLQSYGKGRVIEIDNFNTSNPNAIMYLSNVGTGPLMLLSNSGAGKYIDASGNAYLSSGGNTWVNSSDITKKENINSVNPNDILNKIISLPIYSWNYKNENLLYKHIGPMAEDFYEIFNLGYDNKSISTIDPAGISLAAIKQLSSDNKQLSEELKNIKEEITNLKNMIQELNQKR